MLRMIVILQLSVFFGHTAIAACGANTRTWQADAGTSNWNSNFNWSPRNRPDSAGENALIISDWFNPAWPGNNYTLGCIEIQSGTMSATNNNQVTLVGDYFRNLNPGSLIIGGANTWEVVMQGTAAQTFENVDMIPRLRINNANTVTLTESFSIRDRFLVDAGTSLLVIEKNLTTLQTGAFTIPSGVAITLAAGASWTLNSDLVIDGSLTMGPGSRLIMGNGNRLTIGAAGILDINGTAGNAVTIDAESSSSTFSFDITGTLDAQYLVLDHMDATGVAMNGIISRFDNVSINSIVSGGAGMTLGGSANLPASMGGVGFFGNGGAGPFTNVDGNTLSYCGSPVNFTGWSGLGDTANEQDACAVINWGTEAAAVLQIQNNSAAGIPPATIAKGSGVTQFATFAFSMSGAAAMATNVTSLTLTLDGSNINSDISSIAVHNDTNGNCSFDSGVDTLIGNYTPTGTPGTVTVSLFGEINVVDTTQDCLHVLMSTSSAAKTDNTVGISIESTDHVSNDQGYNLSDTTGPPVKPGVAIITGAAVRRWNGGFSNNMFTAGNWTPNGAPDASIDCEIGNGFQPPRMTSAFSCLNTRFQNSGTINWNNTSNIFNIYGAWVVENGFTYTTSNNAIVNIRGAGDQSVSLAGTTFPNDVTVNSGGVVTFEDSGTIGGNLTINGGTVRIASGVSLRVDGNISVATGTTFDIQPGGELILGNGSTLTVNSGGTLEMVGTAVSSAAVRAVADGSSYTITINNGATIRAQYYSLRNLGVSGLTVNATAIIDGTYFLQNGTFTYPGNASSNLLRLFQEIPGDILDGMSFDSNGFGAGGVISIFTSTGATADTLTMTNYSGNMTGASFTNDNNYLITWGSETNELKLTQQTTAPVSSNQGDVVAMGSFGFQQLNAGAFNNTDITFIRITLTGTGSALDVDSVRLYYDPTCSGSGGTLIGSKTFSGSPARADFLGISGATVEADPTTPPLRCINVEYSLNSLAGNGKTVGAEITSSAHVTNSELFNFNASFAPAVNLGNTSIVGSTTQWTGAISTDWFNAGNWSSGVPSSTLNCIINDQVRDPIISGGTATCKSMDIGNGILTLNAGTLEIYGSLESTGTIVSLAPIVIRDNGVTPTSQNIDVSSTLSEIQFNKTAGGSININSNVNVTSAMSIGSTQNFSMNITANNSLILNGGLTLSGATITMDGASELQIGSGQTLLVNGGTFRTNGTNDAYPQALSNKAHITNTGGTGTWSFSASSGTVDLTGFYIDWLDTNGLNFSGTVSLSNLDGGQLRNLPGSASMRAIQFNTSGSLPATASNFGWNWGPGNTPPAEGTPYFLGFSSGCASQTIDFDQWFGDFWPYTTASTTDKISATNCTILIDRAKSPVSLTHFEAKPYDATVVIEWTTGNEWNHRGFNVYRSLSPDSSFVQVNNELIRNDLFSTNIHGTYAFIDEGVTNGETYYYMLEDLSLMGESQLHGPLSAIPMAALGSAPLIQAGTIVSSASQGSGGGSDSSGGDTLEISEHVWVLSQTENYLRIKIDIPSLSQAPDPLNTSFQKLSIEGYTPSTVAGAPELLNKTIMIPLASAASKATWELVDETLTNFLGVPVTPASEYVTVGDTLIPQWTLDNSVYSVDSASPQSFIEISQVVELNGRFFLPLVVHALKYNPVSQNLSKADQIILDLYLEGVAPWDSIDPSVSPWMREGSIKLGYLEEGMHELSFEELHAAGVSGPLDGVNISSLRLKISSVPVGIDVDSANSIFDAGDRLRFYGPQLRSDEDLLTYAVLYSDPGESSHLAQSVDASMQGDPMTPSAGFWTKKLYEENNLAIFNEPFTEETDHFVWSLIYGVSGGPSSPLSFNIDLPFLSDNGFVTLRAHVKSRTANSLNTLHNLEIYVNGQQNIAAESSFQAVESKAVRFQLPASQFVAGKNQIRLVASGDNLTAGEYDMLYVDRVETFFHQEWMTDSDEALLLGQQPHFSYRVGGFTGANILLYDVSHPSDLVRLENATIKTDSQGFNIEFALDATTSGRRVWLGNPTQLKSIKSFKLIPGSYWQRSELQADVVYIGHKDLLSGVKALGDLRVSQGFKVQYVELESLYNEFGNGLANVNAIKDFVEATRQWQRVPKYFILLGDGTYDPKAFQNDSLKYRFPVKFIKGSSFDYVSDHWFVADDSGIPQAIVGRIPAGNTTQLAIYVNKVLDYELGFKRPDNQAPVQMISDKPLFIGEDFEGSVEDLKSVSNIDSLLNPIAHIKRSQISDAQMKQSIVDSFNQSSIIHYMGHGAENIWADIDVFDNADAQALANNNLPVVVAMNCLNAQYADPGLNSLAESLIFNPNGGAIVFWGSTSLTPPSIQKIYQESFYEHLSQGQFQDLGDLVMTSKIQAGLSSPFAEILYSWSIIGDPMVKPALSHQQSINHVNNPPELERSPATSTGGGGNGCAAMGSDRLDHQPAPWSLVFSFILEVFMVLMVMRLITVFFTYRDKNR